MLRQLAVLCFLYLSAASALANFQDGNSLFKSCTVREDSPIFTAAQMHCVGYIQAISDALEVTKISGHAVCSPDNVTAGQLKDIVTQWLQAKPKLRHLAASRLVAAALQDAFPCQQ